MTWAEAEEAAPGCSAEWDALTSGHPVEVTDLRPSATAKFGTLLWVEGTMRDGDHAMEVTYRYVRGWGWMRWRDQLLDEVRRTNAAGGD